MGVEEFPQDRTGVPEGRLAQQGLPGRKLFFLFRRKKPELAGIKVLVLRDFLRIEQGTDSRKRETTRIIRYSPASSPKRLVRIISREILCSW